MNQFADKFPEQPCRKDCIQRYGFGFCLVCDPKNKNCVLPELSNKWLEWWKGELKDYVTIYSLLENKRKIKREFTPILAFKSDVEKHCLSKQRVKEALKICFCNEFHPAQNKICNNCKLKEELGLEE